MVGKEKEPGGYQSYQDNTVDDSLYYRWITDIHPGREL